MSKIELDNITSGYNLGKINANFVKIEDALTNNVLFRDATGSTAGPNQMVQDIDMDSQSILNLPTPTAPTNPVRLQDLGDYATSTELTEVDNRLTAADVTLQNNIDTANSLRIAGDNTLTSSVNSLDGRVTTLETGTAGDTRYIHWLYNNGSALGGEVQLNIPYEFTSIATVHVNGVRMSYGLAFSYDVVTETVQLAEALEEGDEVVVSIGTEPVDIPTAPQIYVQYLYNNGSAVGGELLIDIPYAFTSISGVHINGISMTYGLAFDYDVATKVVQLADALKAGDELVVSVGTEPLEATALIQSATEEVVLVDGQTVVDFIVQDTNAAEFYVNGPSVDSRLLSSEDFTKSSTTSTSITLTESYPAGSIITLAKNIAKSFDGNIRRELVHNIASLAVATASTNIAVGDAINLAERTTGNGGGAMWDVVLSSSVTENGYDIVQCTGVPTLSLVLRVGAEINVKQFGAVGDNVTDDTAAIQSALNSGSLTVDFTNTLMKCDEITVPANVKCINLNLVKKTAGGSLLLVNSGCELIGSIKGTSTVSTVERGVYVAANDVTDVKLSLRVSNFTYGVHGQPISGTAYADAPKRWTGDLSFENIVGTAGASEGYGLLLSPAHHCTLQVTGKTIARHGVYLAAGASYNNISATIDGCQNYAVQTSSQGGQPATEHNIIQILAVNLSENIAGQSGGVALVGNSNYNSLQLNVDSSGTCAFGALIEGTSGGPYPKSNTIQNSVITGNFTGAEVIKVLNCDSTNINNNVIDAYGTFAVISDRTSGTNGSIFASIIEGNSINAQGQAVRGIYEECTAQPSFIGINQIRNNSTSLRVSDGSGGKRLGFSRRVVFSGTTASIAAGASGDTLVTLPDTLQVAGRKSNVYLTGSSGTYFNVPLTLIGINEPATLESNIQFRYYNGSASAQTLTYSGVSEGD